MPSKAGLSAGAARCEISPPRECPLIGYEIECSPARNPGDAEALIDVASRFLSSLP